ncbi:MAG TPA: Ig-like domain-containing protein, partial [Planctomycetota bacterium]|nr:Ig-like domain-containing protein [Planctomycetota bacterium]
IAQAIAAAILAEESENATPPVPPATLRVDPPAVTLTQPFARAELRVVGTRPGGETVDVTYWAATSYASSDPRVVTVDEYGTLTAITHGDATVTVACGEQRATVAVAVRLPPVADLGGAWAPPSLRRPVLRGTVADGKAVLRVTPPGPGLPGAVVFAFEPAARAFCGGTVFVPLHGGGAAPLAASAGEVEVTLPPDFERGTVYTQAIYGTGGDVCGYAISNGLAIRL